MRERTIRLRERIGSATTPDCRRRRGMATRSNNRADATLKQLQQALESALKHAASLQDGANKNSQKAVRDLEKRIKELRTELQKNSKGWLAEAQDAVTSRVSGGSRRT